MLKSPIFVVMFTTLVVVAALNKLALYFNLYWSVWWFDIPMHFLGGFWVALSALWVISFSASQLLRARTVSIFIVTILIVLVIGLWWETFELYYGISKVAAPDFLADTITDIILDVVGAVFAFKYAYPKIKPIVSLDVV